MLYDDESSDDEIDSDTDDMNINECSPYLKPNSADRLQETIFATGHTGMERHSGV